MPRTIKNNDESKIETLLEGRLPIYEPDLKEIVAKNVAAGRLRFTSSTAEGVNSSDVVFIAVPTPPQPDGSVDLCFIEKVARERYGFARPKERVFKITPH